MKNKKLSINKIRKRILIEFKKKNWTNFEKNINLSVDKYKLDYVLKYKESFLAGIKINSNNRITKRMIDYFIRKINTSELPIVMMTNGKELIIYNNITKSYDIKTINDLPAEEEIIVQYYSSDKRRSYAYIYLFVIVLIFLLLIGFGYTKYQLYLQSLEVQKKLDEVDRQEKLKEQYQDCLTTNINLDNIQIINDYKKEMTDYFKKRYSISVLYEDINNGYNYTYNSDTIYYAASTIKTLDALYLYIKASEGKIDLNKTITYSKNYGYSDSIGMEQHKYGDKVSLRDLVNYAITYSDNSAHFMLIDYIGFNNLKAFGIDLGAKNTLSGTDKFGYINANDAKIYMQTLYNFISKDNELSQELKGYFINSIHNNLKIEGLKINAATKYGYYGSYFHNIGIVFDDNPYIAIVLTKEGNNDFDNIVKDINLQIYKLHALYKDTKKEICYNKTYGE